MGQAPREQSLQVGELGDNQQGRPHKLTRSGRLVALVADRDWVGVFIEFAIVTLGVVLAFQIDQWGQDRRQAREERQFLERMWKETSSIVTESKSAADMHSTEASNLLAIYRAAGNPDELRRFDDEVGGAGCRTGVLPSQGLSDTSAEELLTSGRLNIVSDPALREDLRQMAAIQVEAAEQLAYVRQNAPRVSDRLDRFTTSALDREGNNACRVNWSAVLANPLGVQALLRARRLHQLMADERKQVWDRAVQVHKQLACALKESDCRT